MASDCKRMKFTKYYVCAGDLKHRISLQNRNMTAPVVGVDFDYELTQFSKPWAAIKTLEGIKEFSKINIEEAITHHIVIRYKKDVTEALWILYRGNRWDIDTVTNLNEENKFLLLKCIFRGDADKKASLG